MRVTQSLELSGRDLKLFAFGLSLIVAARGVSLFPFAFSVDSYPKLIAMSTKPAWAAGSPDEILGQGRFGQWVLNELMSLLGIVGPGGDTFYIILAMCCFAVAGVLLARLLVRDSDVALQVCVAGLFIAHPYHAEIFTFREATLTVALAILLGIAGLRVAYSHRYGWALGSLCVLFSLSLYQVGINYVVIALVAYWVLGLLRESGQYSGSPRLAYMRMYFRDTLRPGGLAVGLGLLAYVPIYALSQGLADTTVEHHRGELVPLQSIPGRLAQTAIVLARIMVAPEPVMPVTVKVLLGGILLLSVAGIVLRLRALPFRNAWPVIGILGILFLIALLAIVGVQIPIRDWPPTHRTASAVSVLAAALVAVAGQAEGIWIRRACMAISGVLIFAFIGLNNMVFSDQLRVNHRDFATASRVVAQLEMHSDFDKVRTLVMVGLMPHYPLRYFTAGGMTEVSQSAFGRTWSRKAVIEEVSGYHFDQPTEGDERSADAYCANAKSWPSEDAIGIVDDVAVVCLHK